MSDESDVHSNPEILKLMQASLDAEQLGTEAEPTIEVAIPDDKKTEDKPEAKKPAEDLLEKAEEKKGEEKTEEKPDSSLKESEKKSDEKPKSKYAQEQERLNLTWKKINEEKVAQQAREAAWAKEREAEQRRIIQSQPFRDEHGHSAADYAAFAKAAQSRGETALAQQAEIAAQRVYGAEVTAKQQASYQQLQNDWIGNYEKLAEKHTELNDQSSEMFKQVKQIVAENPLLASDPSGIKLAVEAYEVRKQYQETLSIREENQKLKSQIETLQKNLSLSSGVAAESPKSDKTFDELSDKEQRKQLLGMLTESPEW